MKSKRFILFVIVFAQFLCTSLWFAGNAVTAEMQVAFGLQNESLLSLSTAVQFGFIIGTLLFAIFTLADKVAPTYLFFTCALAGAAINLLLMVPNNTAVSLFIIRFFTGVFLAGIYPVGMKIASDYFKEGLGTSLGFLVGALVLGTAFPYLIALLTIDFQWQAVIIAVSILATIGGFLMVLFVGEGPYRKKMLKTDFTSFFQVFKKASFRSAAFGYFGHMWELYAFWVLVPVIITAYLTYHKISLLSVNFECFVIIAIGSIGCVVAGLFAKNIQEKFIAAFALLLSSICCLLLPLAFYYLTYYQFIAFLLIWGFFVVADSPLFSTMVAKYAPEENRGTALTIVNSVGFAITIISIEMLLYFVSVTPSILIYSMLAIGPVLGLLAMRKLILNKHSRIIFLK